MSNETEGEESVIQEWVDLLTTLIPPDKIEVEDALGNKYKMRASLPGAVETRIMRRLEQIEIPDIRSDVDRARGGSADVVEALGGVANIVIKMASNQSILETLSECFAMAHPRVVREAIEAAKADEDAKEHLPDANISAHDVFSVAALVGGVLPFGLRAVSQTRDTVMQFLPQKG